MRPSTSSIDDHFHTKYCSAWSCRSVFLCSLPPAHPWINTLRSSYRLFSSSLFRYGIIIMDPSCYQLRFGGDIKVVHNSKVSPTWFYLPCAHAQHGLFIFVRSAVHNLKVHQFAMTEWHWSLFVESKVKLDGVTLALVSQATPSNRCGTEGLVNVCTASCASWIQFLYKRQITGHCVSNTLRSLYCRSSSFANAAKYHSVVGRLKQGICRRYPR